MKKESHNPDVYILNIISVSGLVEARQIVYRKPNYDVIKLITRQCVERKGPSCDSRLSQTEERRAIYLALLPSKIVTERPIKRWMLCVVWSMERAL